MYNERMPLYHVNFHTLGNRPIFEIVEYDEAMRVQLAEVILRHTTFCPEWELMPTHVHLIVHDFKDLSRSRVIHHIKGATANGFFKKYPCLREDLLGGHLWTKGYYWVEITSQSQFRATVAYIRNNRAAVGIEPPQPLRRSEEWKLWPYHGVLPAREVLDPTRQNGDTAGFIRSRPCHPDLSGGAPWHMPHLLQPIA
jgi:REP element-mobilizing transposase RayT